MDESKTLNLRIFRRYSLVLVFSSFLVVALILCTNLFFGGDVSIPLSVSTFLFLTYIVLWCYIGYLELYFGVMNANRRVLYYSVVSSAIYVILLLVSGKVDLLKLSIFMVISTVINLMMVIMGLKQLQVIVSKKNQRT